MVKLRLRRIGKKKHPIYKVVATDIRAPRDGRYLEAVGSYDPNVNPAALIFKEERVFHWLQKGAQPTDTIRSLFRRSGLWLRWTLTKRGTDDAKKQEILERWEMAQKDRGKRESDRKARRAERKKKVAAEAAPAPAPAVEKPAAEKPAAEKTATEKPATAEKAAAEKPVAEKPAAEKPAAEKGATEKPAAEKPAAEKPPAEKPATE